MRREQLKFKGHEQHEHVKTSKIETNFKITNILPYLKKMEAPNNNSLVKQTPSAGTRGGKRASHKDPTRTSSSDLNEQIYAKVKIIYFVILTSLHEHSPLQC